MKSHELRFDCLPNNAAILEKVPGGPGQRHARLPRSEVKRARLPFLIFDHGLDIFNVLPLRKYLKFHLMNDSYSGPNIAAIIQKIRTP